MVLNACPVASTNLVSGTGGFGGEPDLAFQRGRDARAVAAGRVGVDLQVLLDVLDGGLGIVVGQKRAGGVEHVVRLRVGDEEAALGQRAVIAGRHDQVLAALAAVGAWEADVDDPAEPHVVDGAEPLRRLLDHHRAIGQVHGGEVVDRVGIGGQEQRLRVHQLGEDDDGVVLGADALKALADRVGGGAAEAVVVDVRARW